MGHYNTQIDMNLYLEKYLYRRKQEDNTLETGKHECRDIPNKMKINKLLIGKIA